MEDIIDYNTSDDKNNDLGDAKKNSSITEAHRPRTYVKFLIWGQQMR